MAPDLNLLLKMTFAHKKLKFNQSDRIMNKLLFIGLFLTSLISYSQLKNNTDGTLYYEEVIETDKSITKVHNAVEQFLATYSSNSNYAIKINKETQIIAKGDIPIIGPNELNIVLNTEFKEGRYRIFLDEITLNNKSSFTNDKELLTRIALDQMKQLYTKQGKLEEFKKLKESGEAEKQVEGFVSMNDFMYAKGEAKLLSFVQSLKEYVLSYDNNSDW